MNTTDVYKIKSTRTGLFSKGGGDPEFSKLGKVWKQRGHVTSHFNQLTARGRRVYQLEEVEVIRYTIVQSEVISYDEWMGGVLERKLSVEQARKQRFADQQTRNRHETYLKLKAEFG